MYEAFYGMKERPFALTPDPSFLFMSSKHSLAMSMLEYSLMGQAGFTVVTGDIGSGKTTLIRQFLRRADRNVNLGVVSNTHAAFGDLLQWVLLAFAIQSDGADKAARYQAFANYLVSQHGAGKQTILIIDEAQNLTIETLEELRLLSNISADKYQLIQMVLVGQPELLDKLKRRELTQFAQRIAVHYHLVPLSRLETRDYIRHRLHVAGVERTVFDETAIAAIFHFSNGVPRLINTICDIALVYGFAQNKREVDVDIIRSVARDRERGSLLTLPKRDKDITREDLIKAAEELSAPTHPSPANDASVGGQFAQVQPFVRGEATDGVGMPAMRSAQGVTPRIEYDEISAYVHREVQRLGTPIMPVYLDEGEAASSGTARPRRGTRSRWLWWLARD